MRVKSTTIKKPRVRKKIPTAPEFTPITVKMVFKRVSVRKQLLLGIGFAVLVLIILNFGFISQNLQLAWYKVKSEPPKNMPAATASTAQADMLWIESLNITAPIKYVDKVDEATFQKALQDGIVHYPETALPGRPGNTYIFGHSSDYLLTKGNYKNVFVLLPNIELGAEIKITDPQGKLYTYVVTETKVVGPQDLEVLSQFNNERKLLTLQTSYPIGTALKRYIVVAELK